MKPDSKDQRTHLYDILESAHIIRQYVSGMTADQFLRSGIVQDAVAKRIEIIGETFKSAGLEEYALIAKEQAARKGTRS